MKKKIEQRIEKLDNIRDGTGNVTKGSNLIY